MIGTNEMILNEATMREAVQFWLTGKVCQCRQTPTVCSVKPTVMNGDTTAWSFRVMLLGPDAAPKES